MASIWTIPIISGIDPAELNRFCLHCGELREYDKWDYKWLSSCRCDEWEEIEYEGSIEGSIILYRGTIEVKALPENPVVYIAENNDRRTRVDGYAPKYVGRTQNFKRRVTRHLNDAKKGRGHYFHEAIRQWGPSAFVWHLLDEVKHPEYFRDSSVYVTEQLKRVEAECIETYQTATRGYNLRTEESPIRKASDQALIRELTYRGYKFH